MCWMSRWTAYPALHGNSPFFRTKTNIFCVVCSFSAESASNVQKQARRPFLLVWLGILIWDVVKNLQLGGPELYGFLCGSAIGLVLGLKNRRDILDASDDLLGQIEELRG